MTIQNLKSALWRTGEAVVKKHTLQMAAALSYYFDCRFSIPSFSSFAMLIVLGAAACHPVTVYAGIGFQPISPEELKMTSEPQAPGAPAVILFREVDRDDNGRTSHEDNYIRIKILTEEGLKYAEVLSSHGSVAGVVHAFQPSL